MPRALPSHIRSNPYDSDSSDEYDGERSYYSGAGTVNPPQLLHGDNLNDIVDPAEPTSSSESAQDVPNTDVGEPSVRPRRTTKSPAWMNSNEWFL